MALYQLRTTIDRSALEQDSVVWGLFGIDTALDPADIIDDIRDAWLDAWATASTAANWPADHFFVSVEAYPAGGGAAAGYSAIDPPVELGDGESMPGEVALAVSHHVDTVRGVRPVGRTYCGPVSTEVAGPRPSPGFQNDTGYTWSVFHSAVVLLAATPVVISKFLDGAPRSPVGLPIVRYSVDDAWDTQRRRGWDATFRSYQTP